MSRIPFDASRINAIDVLKFFAIVTMTVDHLGLIFFPDNPWLRVIGRTAFPVFFFVIGYKGFTRIPPLLVAYALAVSIVEMLHEGKLATLNILFTVIICRLGLRWFLARYDPWLPGNTTTIFTVSGILLLFAPFTYFIFDYGTFALLIALIGYWASQDQRNLAFLLYVAAVGCVHVGWQWLVFGFSPAQGAVMALLVGAQFGWFAVADPRKYLPLSPTVPVRVSLAVSRRSLQYYFYHLTFLRILAMLTR